MIDMMSLLLGKMDQIHQQPEQNRTSNSREDSGSGSRNEVEGRDKTTNQRDAYTKGSVTRPIFPTFTPREEQPQVASLVPYADEARQTYLEYTTLPPDLRDMWSFNQFMNQRNRRNGGRNDYHTSARTDHQDTLGKIPMPDFDGSDKSTARAWCKS